MCALSVCLSLCQQPSGARRGGSSKEVGAGKEVALTSSNVWLSLLETPSWAAPPSCLSRSSTSLLSPSLQTPPVEPSPDLLPRRPTFLRLATLKGPTQAHTQVLPSCPPPVCTFRQPEVHKDRVGHRDHLCIQEVGAHRTLGSQTNTNLGIDSLPI